MLCNACQAVFHDSPNKPDVSSARLYTQDSHKFKDSTTSGCHLCYLRWSRLSAEECRQLLTCDFRLEYHFLHNGELLRFIYYQKVWPDVVVAAEEGTYDGSDGWIVKMGDEWCYALKVAGVDFALIGVEEDDGEVAGRFSGLEMESSTTSNTSWVPVEKEAAGRYEEHVVESSTASESSWRLVERWLARCLEQHTVCGHGYSSRDDRLPTRLIDLGPTPMMEPRLCDTKELSQPVKYFTMSHRWGKHEIPTLRMEKIDEWKGKIDPAAISKSFRDAMEITKKLGYQYIWIDSLCIIQDSPDLVDWRTESAKMDAVYRNGVCNISATAALDGRGGCFVGRSPLLVQPLKVQLEIENLPRGEFYCVDYGLWPHSIDEAELNNRAWVVQERVLSPRNIHFAKPQLFWECRESRCCESFPGGLPQSLSKHLSNKTTGVNPLMDGVELRKRLQRPHEPTLGAYEVWNQIVEAYTKCDLTADKDKMVAIAGLAKEMQTRLNDTYVAGTWKRYLAEQLPWFAQSNATRYDAYVAPSWSWASLKGAIFSPCVIREADSRNIMIKVLDAEVNNISDNSFGQLAAGYIRIRGSLIKGVFTRHVDNNHTRTASFEVADNTGRVDVDYMPDPDIHGEEGVVYCVPIRNNAPERKRKQRFSGIVLQPTGKAKGQFRRFGHLTTRPLGLPANSVTSYHHATEEDRLSEDLYEEEDGVDDEGVPQYIFTIV